jgi:hypothetical protein
MRNLGKSEVNVSFEFLKENLGGIGAQAIREMVNRNHNDTTLDLNDSRISETQPTNPDYGNDDSNRRNQLAINNFKNS